MKIERVPDLLQFFTSKASKMKILLFLSLEEEVSKDLLDSLSKLSQFGDNGQCSLAFIYDEAEHAEDIFQIFKVEYAPTCLLLNSDYSALGILFICFNL
jgi:hypothetical protein